MNATASSDLLDLAVFNLQLLLRDQTTLSIESLNDASEQLSGSIRVDRTSLNFIVLEHGTLGEVRALSGKDGLLAPTVFVVPYLDHGARQQCMEAGINFIDTTGNCRLVAEGVNILIDQQDRAPRNPISQGRAFQYKGLKVIHDVYVQPELLNMPYRQIAELTGVSTGSISGIFEDLRSESYLLKTPEGRKLSNCLQLVRRWAYTFLDTVRPKLFRADFRALHDEVITRIEALSEPNLVRVGGEMAAQVREEFLYSSKYCLYTSLRIPNLVRLGLVPITDASSERDYVEVLHPFSTVGAERHQGHRSLSLVSDLIILSDLLNTHDPRSLEAAEHLIEHAISDTLQRAGFYL